MEFNLATVLQMCICMCLFSIMDCNLRIAEDFILWRGNATDYGITGLLGYEFMLYLDDSDVHVYLIQCIMNRDLEHTR